MSIHRWYHVQGFLYCVFDFISCVSLFWDLLFPCVTCVFTCPSLFPSSFLCLHFHVFPVLFTCILSVNYLPKTLEFECISTVSVIKPLSRHMFFQSERVKRESIQLHVSSPGPFSSESKNLVISDGSLFCFFKWKYFPDKTIGSNLGWIFADICFPMKSEPEILAAIFFRDIRGSVFLHPLKPIYHLYELGWMDKHSGVHLTPPCRLGMNIA